MSIIVEGVVTLEDLITVVLRLSEVEQEELKQILQKRKLLNWNEEWEKVTTRFHQAFERWPQEEVEADFQKALDEVRREKDAKMG
jgi:hypothetical protein